MSTSNVVDLREDHAREEENELPPGLCEGMRDDEADQSKSKLRLQLGGAEDGEE